VVHCPLSHRYFGHRKFQCQRLRELGVNVSLGTDSLASNESLNMFAEMREFRRIEPGLRAEELLATVTVNPARALKKESVLGKIAPGAHADLIALPFAGALDSVYEEIVDYRKPIDWMMVDGQNA
ncbi:MAG TPA: amidohydrolase family protein, partial [Chthoniobacteraceae bacterium]|nr:amidohydrolase family protein [Chthoniobacteraceae bacterium]